MYDNHHKKWNMKWLLYVVMKSEFSNKMDHDLLTHAKRFNDFMGSFERIRKEIYLGIEFLQTFDSEDLFALAEETIIQFLLIFFSFATIFDSEDLFPLAEEPLI